MSRQVDAMEGSEDVGEPAHQGRLRLRQAFRVALAAQRVRLSRRIMLRDGSRWFGRLGSGALVLALMTVALFPELSRWVMGGGAMVVASLACWWMVRRIHPSTVAQIGHLDAITDAKASVLSAHHVVGEGNGAPLGAMDVPILEAALTSLARVPAHLGVMWPWRELASMTVVGGAACAGLFLVPAGTAQVVLSDEVADQVAEATTQVERLAALAPIVSEEEREALDAAAEEAAALREQLGDMAVRDAMDSMEQMEEALVEARLRRGEAQESAAEAAAEALAEEPEMAEAVRERDLEALDRAVTQAAARREAADRETARRALEEAAQAAGEAGDEALEESLLRRRGLLDRRSEQADLARRLAEAMPELMEGELGRQLERLSRDGEGEALQEAAVDAMTEAWSRLSPEERAHLAERLRSLAAQENDAARSEGAEASEGEAMSADDYERMLRETLTQLEEARAASGGEAAGGRPMPLPQRGSGQSGAGQSGSGQGSGQAGNGQAGNGQGSGQAGNGQSGSGQGGGGGDGQGSGGGASGQGNADGSGAGGGGGGGGQGPSGGETAPVESDSQLARVRPGVGAGAPSRAWTEWQRPQGLDGDGQATGGTTGSSASHGGGISRSRIPPDYEEHVRVYFDGANE